METWQRLEAGIDGIMTALEKGLSYARYMELYTAVYNHCTATRLSGAVGGAGGAVGSGGAVGAVGGAVNRGPNLLGGFLYEQLGVYLKRHLTLVHAHYFYHHD